jgi:DNA invertase Pin-like site-specific DNA recombinase
LPKRRFVAYYRVSTTQQGRSGLGLDAQREAVAQFLNGGGWGLLGAFTEVESGKRADRPQLAQALALCRLTGAVLVIAKLDRLSRDAHFLIGLEKAGVEFVAADMPNANRLTVHLMAVIAQAEREMISKRTKEALAAARDRRKREGKSPLGGYRGGKPPPPGVGTAARRAKADTFAARVRPTIEALQTEGKGRRQIAAALMERGIMTAEGGRWDATKVRNVLKRWS